MIRSSRTMGGARRTVLSALTLLATLTLALGSCSKRLTTVDPSYTRPEGRFSPDAQLVAWYDSPVEEVRYLDRHQPPIGPVRDPFCPQRILVDDGDSVVSVQHVQLHPPGSVNTMVFDRTPATAFSPMRREANGGYRQTLDFPIRPLRKWLESEWEVYSYTDPAPSGFTPATYIARGEVSGLASAESPVTNEGVIQGDEIGDIDYLGNCLPCDSLFTLRWKPVAGAARYMLHVYQLTPGASDDDNLRSGAAAPINTVKSKDFLVASTDPSVTSFKLGDSFHAGAEVFIDRIRRFSLDRTPVYNLLLNVRVAAIDAKGQLIAYTHGDYGKIDAGTNYILYRLGSVIVQPRNPRDFPPGTSGGCQREPSP